MSISYAQNVGLVKRPPQVKIGNNIYRTVQIGNLIWLAECLAEPLGVQGVNYKVFNGIYHYGAIRDANRADVKIKNLIQGTGFRLPTRSDTDSLLNNNSLPSLCSTAGWNGLGTNETTLNLQQANVYLLQNADILKMEGFVFYPDLDNNNWDGIQFSNGALEKFNGGGFASNPAVPCRLCRDV